MGTTSGIQCLAVVVALGVAAVGGSATAEARRGPSGPAFYKPPAPLPGKRHGAPIWVRPLAPGTGLAASSLNERVLYRSTRSDGKPVAVSGLIAIPRGRPPRGGWPIVTWGHGTAGIADKCAPSRDPVDVPNYDYLLNAGLAVVFTDYQGLGTPGTHQYLVGEPEGRSMLDIVRAARKLDARLGRRVIIGGFSQGAHAALWATALAPSWTPELDVRGTVAAAPPSHIRRQAQLVSRLTERETGLAALAALIFRGVDAAHPRLGLSNLLTARAAPLYPQTLTRCYDDLLRPDSFGSLAPAELFKSLSPALPLFARSDPERLSLKTPVFIAQGTADQIVPSAFTDRLYTELTDRGARIEYRRYPGKDHAGVVAACFDDAFAFTRRQLRRGRR